VHVSLPKEKLVGSKCPKRPGELIEIARV